MCEHILVPFDGSQLSERALERAFNAHEDAEAIAAAVDREIQTIAEVGRPTREILQLVDDQDVDHVIMGSHGRRGISRFILGSVAEAVIRRSPVPVTIVR